MSCRCTPSNNFESFVHIHSVVDEIFWKWCEQTNARGHFLGGGGREVWIYDLRVPVWQLNKDSVSLPPFPPRCYFNKHRVFSASRVTTETKAELTYAAVSVSELREINQAFFITVMVLNLTAALHHLNASIMRKNYLGVSHRDTNSSDTRGWDVSI